MIVLHKLLSIIFDQIDLDSSVIVQPILGDFWHAVKLIYADDLQHWGRFKEYREHNSISYAAYWAEKTRVESLKKKVSSILKAQDRLEDLESRNLEEYDKKTVEIPFSLFKRLLHIPLVSPSKEHTQLTSSLGDVQEGKLVVKGKWRKQYATITYSCPKNILYEEEVNSLQKELKDISLEDSQIVQEIKSSRFTRPVLFISHHWEGNTHPDPDNTQYQKLCNLRECFLIYDYSSFPQNKNDSNEIAELKKILANMSRLIRNVVILNSLTYLERGWCLYEYVVASLSLSTVCDELRDPEFVKLRNFRATRPTVPENIIRGHSIDSAIQNGIAEGILDGVSRILLKFNSSKFAVEEDREIVTELLVDKLLELLPSKKEYPSPNLGEWVDKPWTREELHKALVDGLQWDELYKPYKIKPYQLKVPYTLDEAMVNNFALDKSPPNSPWSFLERISLFES